MSTDLLSNPQWLFQPRGGLPNGYHARQRRRRASRQEVVGDAPRELSLAAIIGAERLLRVYQDLKRTGGLAKGIDGIGFDDLSTAEIAAALRCVARAIRERRYRPYPTRSVFILKPNGRFRELRIGVLCDRVVAAALQQALAQRFDELLLPGCYGFRRGSSIVHLLADMEATMRREQRFVLATDDILEAFPSVRIADAIAVLAGIVQDHSIIALVELVVRGHDGQSRQIGIDQGSALSPDLLNQLLNVCLDRPFSADQAAPPWLRWVDDLAYLCHSVSEGLQAIERVRNILAPAGFSLKGNAGTPIDLRQLGTGKLLLGYQVSWGCDRLCLSVPEQAWAKVQGALNHAHTALKPWQTAVDVVHGWLNAYGPALGGVDGQVAVERILDLAAGAGFREMGSREALGEVIEASRAHWESLRERASAQDRHLDHNARAPHGDPPRRAPT